MIVTLSPEKKSALRKKLKLSWATYWCVFFLFIAVSTAAKEIPTIPLVAMAAWFASAIWLSTVVGDVASANGGSAGVWAAGTLFLGPLGALFMPAAQLAALGK